MKGKKFIVIGKDFIQTDGGREKLQIRKWQAADSK